jgi:uncharacterized integral membrane protein
MRVVRRLVLAALFVALLVGGWRFAAENPGPVVVSWLVGTSGELPLWLVLLVAFAAGAALTAVVAMLHLARLGMLTRRYRKAVSGLEAEVHELRTLPLAPEGEPDTSADAGPEPASARGP